jgi:hypothetical protein
MKSQYIAKIPSTVAGIPCLIGVITYDCVNGDSRCTDSDYDFNGYTDIEFDILDRKGYKAGWLEKKLTPSAKEYIEDTIQAYFN